MTSFTRIALAGLATLVIAGSAEAMPIATPTTSAAPIVETALVVTKVVRRPVMRVRPMVRVMRPRRTVIVKKVIR